MALRPRDIRLIDALDGRAGIAIDEIVWRVAREGRDPTSCSASGGRWDDTTFEVLYTSRTREGSLAEMLFHLRAGQPFVPSKLRFSLREVRVRLNNVLDLSSLEVLDVAEVAFFDCYDGLLVPSSRSSATNLIVFCDRTDPDQLEALKDHGVVDWNSL